VRSVRGVPGSAGRVQRAGARGSAAGRGGVVGTGGWVPFFLFGFLYRVAGSSEALGCPPGCLVGVRLG
jgi:hypothetical protein